MSNYASLRAYSGKAVLPLQASFGGSAAEYYAENYANDEYNAQNSYSTMNSYDGVNKRENYNAYIQLKGYSGQQPQNNGGGMAEFYAQEYSGASGSNNYATLKGYNRENFENGGEQQEFNLPENFENGGEQEF